MPATVNSSVGSMRDHARRRHDRVATRGEEVEERGAELVGGTGRAYASGYCPFRAAPGPFGAATTTPAAAAVAAGRLAGRALRRAARPRGRRIASRPSLTAAVTSEPTRRAEPAQRSVDRGRARTARTGAGPIAQRTPRRRSPSPYPNDQPGHPLEHRLSLRVGGVRRARLRAGVGSLVRQPLRRRASCPRRARPP